MSPLKGGRNADKAAVRKKKSTHAHYTLTPNTKMQYQAGKGRVPAYTLSAILLGYSNER